MGSLDFAEALTNDSPYDYMEKELSRDMRRNKIRGDISERYQDKKNIQTVNYPETLRK